MATKLEGEGGKAFVAGPLKNFYFLRLPLAIAANGWKTSAIPFGQSEQYQTNLSVNIDNYKENLREKNKSYFYCKSTKYKIKTKDKFQHDQKKKQ